jgi:hypothetical protein
VDSVEIVWPNGTVQRFTDVPVNRFVTLVEGAASVETHGTAGRRREPPR